MHRPRADAARLLVDRLRRSDRRRVLSMLIECVGGDTLPDRPGRFEPRRVKRRKKNYSVMNKPRAHYHVHADTQCR